MTDPTLLNNRYHLVQILGSGGMAVVYQAQDRMLERPVAIKVLRERYSRDPAFRERFRQEARAAANLSHPNIVTVHDFGYDEKRLFIVMEHVPGETLKTIIEREGIFSVAAAVPIIVQICAGVGYAHRAGLVHCDVKPHNVLVTPDRRVKVTDFGIARALSSIQPDERSEIVWGSPQYFSPEQARGLAPSPASDVYGIGVIFYQMLTGRLPFKAADSVELARMHRDLQPVPPVEINPEIPPAINDLLLKVLSKEPAARYRTADQLGRVLNSLSDRDTGRSEALDRAPDWASPEGATIVQEPVPQRATVTRRIFTPNPEDTGIQSPERDPVNGLGIDWVNVFVGLIAIIAVGGLIPFWIWVYFVLYGPS
ncbi:MAG TPA: protein kinase [Anaerolineales bacterium]|nr:protein kinase [Anaerolineales bacterium]